MGSNGKGEKTCGVEGGGEGISFHLSFLVSVGRVGCVGGGEDAWGFAVGREWFEWSGLSVTHGTYVLYRT